MKFIAMGMLLQHTYFYCSCCDTRVFYQQIMGVLLQNLTFSCTRSISSREVARERIIPHTTRVSAKFQDI